MAQTEDLPAAKRPAAYSRGRVSAVIVNWNGRHHLEACLESLAGAGGLLELIVVDNGSTDGSLEYLRGRPDIRLLAQRANLGYAEANNLGIAAAAGEYVLLLNNDTVAGPGFLEPLLAAIEADPMVGAVQSKLLTFEEPHRIDGYGSYLTWTGFLYHLRFDQPDEGPRPPFEIFAAKGAAMLVRRELLSRVGGFDADFFAYLEDTDLSWRIWLSGSRVLCVPESIVLHRGAGTAGTLALELVFFHSFKNRIWMLLKNLSPGRLALILPLHLALDLAAAAVYAGRGAFGPARGILRGVGWNLAHLRRTLTQRRTVQRSLRRVSDAVLWPSIARRPRPAYYLHLLTGGLRDYRE